jgi:Ser/Thr protein kinase RdoA (MazF antagonist)
LEGEVSELGSSQDQNCRLRTAGGDFVLKVANRASTALDMEVGDAAMEWLGRAEVGDAAMERPGEGDVGGAAIVRPGKGDIGFAVPAVVPTLGGARSAAHDGHLARLVTWVDGVPLADAGALDAEALRGLGALAARCALALADFSHPGLDRPLQWEPRQAPALFGELGGSVADPERRALVTAAMAPLEDLLASPAAAALPIQAVHCDITDYNVVASSSCSLIRHTGTKEQLGDGDPAGGRLEPSGLIDFGDVIASWRVTEAAHAAMSAVFHDLDDPLGGVGEVLGGFDAVAPLSPAEVDAVWPLILARAVVCALSSTHQASLGASSHLTRLMAEDWTVLEAVLAIPASAATPAMRLVCAST